MNRIFFTENGRITRVVSGIESDPHMYPYVGEFYLDGYCNVENQYISGGVVIDFPSKPTPSHVFNYTTKQWEDPRTLDDRKAAQWTQIKQARSAAEYAGFTWDGSTFDSDAISQSRITGAATLANLSKQLGQPYEITWTLADNSTRTLSADEMILVGLALGQHVQTNFNKGQQLYEQIQQAITKEEVEAVVW